MDDENRLASPSSLFDGRKKLDRHSGRETTIVGGEVDANRGIGGGDGTESAQKSGRIRVGWSDKRYSQRALPQRGFH